MTGPPPDATDAPEDPVPPVGTVDEQLAAAVAENGHLTTALRNARAIGTAIGVLMERYAVDSDQAFALLRRVSSTENRKLVQVAEDVAHGRLVVPRPAPSKRVPPRH